MPSADPSQQYEKSLTKNKGIHILPAFQLPKMAKTSVVYFRGGGELSIWGEKTARQKLLLPKIFKIEKNTSIVFTPPLENWILEEGVFGGGSL